MQVKIKSIHMENFKGCKNMVYELSGKNISLIGQNGTGKTTIKTAYMWVMADKDSELKSNPDIRPLDTEECTPSVEIVFDIDGTEVVVEKIQKIKKKEYEKNGKPVTEISAENSYKVNHAPMGLTQFKKKMAAYGVDFDRFLHLSHPDAFTNQMSAKKDMEKMRDTMFEMTQTYTDLQIAEILGSVPEVLKLLKINTKDEIRATQNDTLKEIRENYGKSGEIIRAKIAGLEQSKTDIDVAELELQKKTLSEQISDKKSHIEDISKEFEAQQKASDGVIELKMELNGLQRKANEDLEKQRREITRKSDDLITKKNDLVYSINDMKKDWAMLSDRLKTKQESLEKARAEYERSIVLEFDENSLVCQYCGQDFPADEQERIKANFEANKEKDIESIKERGNGLNEEVKQIKSKIADLEKLIKEKQKKYFSVEKELKELMAEEEKLPQSIDISSRHEVQEIQRQIAEKEAAMNKGNSAEGIRQKLKDEAEELQNQMDKVNEQFALVKKNIQIDEDILEEREKQKQYEQNKADAERILDQLDMVSKKKNELLTDEVNSHFKLVKFRLFDYLKNGTVVDDCTPMIDGKSINNHSNGALRVLAKLDIIAGLQNFYGQYYPVFVDDFALVTDNTECRIDMDCQLIKLVAEKGVKELKIEMEG